MTIKVWETDLNLTDNTDDTSGESYLEEARLNTTLAKLILPAGISVNDFDNKPVIQVLKENGIKTLFDFACLTPTMIDDLSYHPYGKWRPLPILAKCCLKILLGLYHHASYELQRPIHLHLVNKATFDHYCLHIYDPEADWPPWYKSGPHQVLEENQHIYSMN